MEIWAGAEVNANSWSVYSGTTTALFSSLEASGWRFRTGGGYGTYSYDAHGTTIRGHVGFGEVLLGYQHQLGQVTLKGFAGAAAESHSLSPFDPESTVVGTDYGIKAAIESWWEINPQTWSSLDLSWSSVHGGTYAVHARVGYRIRTELSLGLEAAANGNTEYDGGRLGALTRFAWSGGEISAGAGASIDRSGETGGYGTMNALFRY